MSKEAQVQRLHGELIFLLALNAVVLDGWAALAVVGFAAVCWLLTAWWEQLG
jgi:hypothetical protein